MKTKKIILLSLVAILATSCKSEEVEYIDLTEAQKQLVPYEKGQIIRFIDDAGQSIDFTVIRSELLWLRRENEEDDTYVMFRRKLATLRSEPDNFEIGLFIDSYVYDYLSKNYFGWLGVHVRPHTIRDWRYSFRSDKEGNLSNDNYPLHITEIHKSLEINGKVYYDVVEEKYTDTVYDGGGGQSEVTFQLFYNKTYGVLQVNRDGKNILMRDPKTEEGKENNNPNMIDCFDAPIAERNVQ